MRSKLTYNTKYLRQFVSDEEFAAMKPFVSAAHDLIENKSGAGNDFLGWVDMPENYDKEEFARIQKAAK